MTDRLRDSWPLLRPPRSEARGIRAWLRAVPPGVPGDARRAFVFTTISYVVAIPIYAAMAVVFLLATPGPLAIASAATAAVLAALLAGHRRGRYRRGPHIASAAVAAHGLIGAATFPAGGFELYLFVVAVYPWLVPYYPRWVKAAYAVAVIAGLVAGPSGWLPTIDPGLQGNWHWGLVAFNAFGVTALLVGIVASYEQAVRRAEAEVRRAYSQSEALLHNILPRAVANRLKQDRTAMAERHEAVSILFADLVDFTAMAERLSPERLVRLLDEIFSAFDELTERYGAEKIKTIGDAYMVAVGLPEARMDHAQVAANLALDMMAAMAGHLDDQGKPLSLRIGISSGAVVAGVIGRSKFAYDLWGDPVNTAGRMESHGLPGHIQVSAATESLLRESHRLEPRGPIEIKGKGIQETWFLLGRRQA